MVAREDRAIRAAVDDAGNPEANVGSGFMAVSASRFSPVEARRRNSGGGVVAAEVRQGTLVCEDAAAARLTLRRGEFPGLATGSRGVTGVTGAGAGAGAGAGRDEAVGNRDKAIF